MTVTLDRNRSFGTVTPPEQGASFHQDGFYFDHHGDLIEALLDGESRKRLASLSVKKEKQKEQSRAASNPAPAAEKADEAGTTNQSENAPMKKFVVVVDDKMIDLALFAQDKIVGPKPNWVALQKAIKADLKWEIDSKLALIGRLSDEGAMNVEDGAITDRDKDDD